MNQTRPNPRQPVVDAQNGESHLNPPALFFSLSKRLPLPFSPRPQFHSVSILSLARDRAVM